jgi:hypothetical protein
MKRLIWQFFYDSRRPYDGSRAKEMAEASRELARRYAEDVEAEYQFETNSVFYTGGCAGGPAMDRFQLLEERYDAYDQILYLDTDILISPRAPDIFRVAEGAAIAGINRIHPRDRELLDHGWLADAVDRDRYLACYTHGAVMVLSREFRQWLRKNCDPWLIDEDARRVAEEPDSALRFPVYDQSLVSYFLTKSPFTLTRLSKSILRGPFFYHHGGGKDEHRVMRYFERYQKLAKRWEHTRPGNTRGLLKSLQVAYLRRTTPTPVDTIK